MASPVTDGEINGDNEEDGKPSERNNVAKRKEVGTAENNRSDIKADDVKGSVNDQGTREGHRDKQDQGDADIEGRKDNKTRTGNGSTSIKRADNDCNKSDVVDVNENKKKDNDRGVAEKKDKDQHDNELPNDTEHDEFNDDGNKGFAINRLENFDLTKSQDGLDQVNSPEGQSSLKKWHLMGDLQDGDSSDGVFSPTSTYDFDEDDFDEGSSVDYPVSSPGATRQPDSPEPPDENNPDKNAWQPHTLPTILESDPDEAPVEQNQVKEDEKVLVLRKGNIKKLLRHLLNNRVLTEGEYKRCDAKPRREDMCDEVMKIVLRKEGGESLFKQALKAVQGQAGAPRKVRVSSKMVMEKEKEISRLKAKINELQRELASKSEEITDLKKDKPVNIVEPLITTRERNMIHTITERRRASRELEAQPNISIFENEATRQLQQELDYLKQELMIRDKEMETVQHLKNLYPYISDVLGCPIYPIQLPDHDSTVPMYCPVIKLSLTNANPHACRVEEEDVLINQPSTNKTNGYRKYQGTSGATPFLLPVMVSKMLPHPIQYWETHTIVYLECMVLSFHTLFEIGICEESIVDKMTWLHKSPRSWSIRIGICRKHHWGVCAQVYGSASKHGLCFTHVMSNIPDKTAMLCYGLVLDVGTGKVGLIDIGKERVLHTFDVQFKENLYPMFGVQPLPGVCSIDMAVRTGDQIEMTERKENLITKALSSIH